MTIFANAGDLHLYNRNIRSTLLMKEASAAALDELERTLETETDIDILTFMGDIQHLVPQGKTSLKDMYGWKQSFKRMGEIMYPRFQAVAANLVIIDRDGNDLVPRLLSGEIAPIFALKGNHDFDSETDFTFYDYLVAEGVICEPRYIISDGVQINYHHYREADVVIPRQAGVERVVGYYHDNIDYPEMPFWMGETGGYRAVDILNGVDVAVIAHIHKQYEAVRITTTDGGECLVRVQGSIGRTQFAEGQIRDVGYVSVVDTSNITEIGSLEIALIPQTEYFNFNRAVAESAQRRDFREFSLSVGEVHVTSQDARDEIRGLNIEEDVKELGIHYLNLVMQDTVQ